jgi:hypothetical protein
VAVVERELVGGLCSYWACIPSKSLLRPGEAVNGAREAGAGAEVDVQDAFGWRDFMISNYSDASAARWLTARGIALLRGHVLAREPAPLGEALGEALRHDGIELVLGVHATAASRDGEDFVLRLEDGRAFRGDRVLVATGRRPRVEGIGLETVGITADVRGVSVDSHMRAGERLWVVGDITGIWQLTHVGPPARSSRSHPETAALALELAPIRVNLIAAGFVDTPLSASYFSAEGLEARREELRRTLPIGRVVGPADVAALAVHLMTNTALTGATYDIDGGQQFVS